MGEEMSAALLREFRSTDYTEVAGPMPSTCWVWNLSKTRAGYGRVMVAKRHIMAHRYVWIVLRGEDVPAGLDLDHLCRNKSCVNPEHMEPVTRRENLMRRTKRGRLSIDDVRAIRDLDGPEAEVGARFGVSRQAIWAIRTGRTWSDVA